MGDWLTTDSMIAVKAVVALAGAAVLLRAQPGSGGRRPARDAALALAALASVACWFNLGRFHFNQFLHFRELYHYYLGAKYAPELSYTRLYQCTIVAESEVPEVASRLGALPVRDLATNDLGRGAAALLHPGECKRHFTPERWRAFTADSHKFRGGSSFAYWADALADHGYNATPVWALPARALTGLAPLSRQLLLGLGLLDVGLLFAAFCAIAWAFGFRALCAVLIFWGTNHPGRYYWIGGSFLRQDWFALTIIGIALLARGKPFASGFALAWATLLRVFPGFLLAALAVKVVVDSVAARRLQWSPSRKRFVLGALAATVALVPAAAVRAGGLESWRAFAVNARKHLATPLTNNMGWKTVVSFDPALRGARLVNESLHDAYGPWKQAQRETFQRRRWIWALGIVAYLLLLALALRGCSDWEALALGSGLIVFAAQLSCYYYAFLLLLVLPAKGPRWGPSALALSSAASCLVALVSADDDVTYVVTSAFFLLAMVAVTAGAAFGRRGSADESPAPNLEYPAGPI